MISCVFFAKLLSLSLLFATLAMAISNNLLAQAVFLEIIYLKCYAISEYSAKIPNNRRKGIIMNKMVKIAILGLFSVATLGAMNMKKEIEINLKPGDLKPNGLLTKEGAKNLFSFLAKYNNRELGLKEPESVEDLDVGVSFHTTQLFKVTCPGGQDYILKGAENYKDERKNLKAIHDFRGRSSQFKDYIDPKVKNGLQINLPFAYVSYWDQSQKKHVLFIMRIAKGRSFKDLMGDFKENPNSEGAKKELIKAYYGLGAALAKFYKEFRNLDPNRAIIQGDLHGGNIFYDEDSNRITLIDNEKMAEKGRFQEKGRISKDLGNLFVRSLFLEKWQQEKLFGEDKWEEYIKEQPPRKRPMPLKYYDRWYSIVIPSFIRGFIGSRMSGSISSGKGSEFEKLEHLLLKALKTREDHNSGNDSRFEKAVSSIEKVLEKFKRDNFKRRKRTEATITKSKPNTNNNTKAIAQLKKGEDKIMVYGSYRLGKKIYYVDKGKGIEDIYFDKNGYILVAILDDGTERIWDSSKDDYTKWGQAAIKPHETDIIAVLAPEGEYIKVYKRSDLAKYKNRETTYSEFEGHTKKYDPPRGKRFDRILFSKKGNVLQARIKSSRKNNKEWSLWETKKGQHKEWDKLK